MERVQCRKIRHSYDGVRDAVGGLDLEIKRGEVLALIGPNGAGKSTTLRILATLQRPDEGSVTATGPSVRGTLAATAASCNAPSHSRRFRRLYAALRLRRQGW